MAKNLVIVESPAKAKTISRFLGSEFKVLASMGHVRDLPKTSMAIDVEHDFKPKYVISSDKKKTVKILKDEMEEGTNLWLATDEDREGEAIGWHLLSALDIDESKTQVKRIVFHEITKKAIDSAVANPRAIDKALVDAQQARRVLDRLVGYELSPLLWRKVRGGLSAGRVQSVAVRLVVDREREIRAFKPEEFWKIKGEFAKLQADEFGRQNFFAVLEKSADGKKLVAKEGADEVLKMLEGASYKIGAVEAKEVERNPAAPFTTSTLQQEASRKLGFSVKKTMMLAQRLYEGVDVGDGAKGLITYMRTDSFNLSEIALTQAREVIGAKFGAEYALPMPRFYKGKKGAQEAHEAIRPTDLSVFPDDVMGKLEKDQGRLYELIWKRTLACQMAPAKLHQVKAEVSAVGAGSDLSALKFHAKGESVIFPGFMKVYMEDLDEDEIVSNGFGGGGAQCAAGAALGASSGAEGEGKDAGGILPVFSENEDVKNLSLDPSQHFTKPPARYTEASLVKKMESEGIGRPSTYAPTISTIQLREYVKKDGKYLIPTDVGEVVTDVLVENFPNIVDYKFTAEMEEGLDDIAEGKKEWVPVIRAFYGPFHATIEEKMKTLKRADIVSEKTDEVCDLCGKPMVIKLGRYGKFLSCSGYPECKNAKPLAGEIVTELGGTPGHKGEKYADVKIDEKMEKLQKENTEKVCEKCGKPMKVRKSKYGYFLGCTGYPKCKTIVAIEGEGKGAAGSGGAKAAPVKTGVKCPDCGEGELVERHTRRGGKIFWGCDRYPKCKHATWDKPV